MYSTIPRRWMHGYIEGSFLSNCWGCGEDAEWDELNLPLIELIDLV
jgi:hypothetical protein